MISECEFKIWYIKSKINKKINAVKNFLRIGEFLDRNEHTFYCYSKFYSCYVKEYRYNSISFNKISASFEKYTAYLVPILALKIHSGAWISNVHYAQHLFYVSWIFYFSFWSSLMFLTAILKRKINRFKYGNKFLMSWNNIEYIKDSCSSTCHYDKFSGNIFI